MLDAVANNCAVFITTTKMSRYYETFFLAKKEGNTTCISLQKPIYLESTAKELYQLHESLHSIDLHQR